MASTATPFSTLRLRPSPLERVVMSRARVELEGSVNGISSPSRTCATTDCAATFVSSEITIRIAPR